MDSETDRPTVSGERQTGGKRLMFQTEIRQQLLIPLRSHADVVLYVPLPMSAEDWDQFMAVLAAMKPGIVQDPWAPGTPAGGQET